VSEMGWIGREPVSLDSPIVDTKDDDFYVRAGQDIYRARGFGKMLVELDAREHRRRR